MGNKFLYTTGILLGSIMLLMIIGTGFGQAQNKNTAPQDGASFVSEFCFNDGDQNLGNMDVSDIVNVYTKKTNDYFNKKIAKIMQEAGKAQTPNEAGKTQASPTPNLDEYKEIGEGLCRGANGQESVDLTCQSIAVCNGKNADNGVGNHPYCMAMTLLGVPPEKIANYNYDRLKEIKPLKYSYFCYKAALDFKRNAIYDGTVKVENAWSKSYRGAASSLTANLIDFSDSTKERVKFIDEEIKRAKMALDQTLDAYSQLKSAWQIHVNYVDIFAELVKYRDHLVAIRKQTDAFPIRFINASTTKCL